MFQHEREAASRVDAIRLIFRSATGRYHYARMLDRNAGVLHGVDYRPTADIDAALEQFSAAGLTVETIGEFEVRPA